jgi:hypothetical protein
VLAYVFWHRPRAGVDAAEYVAALTAFHERIGVPSWFAALGRPPWGEGVGWYEDWYLVEDWNGLGRLNEVAITGARQPPHDVAAALAREGIAGIYGLIGGQPEPGWPSRGGPATRTSRRIWSASAPPARCGSGR